MVELFDISKQFVTDRGVVQAVHQVSFEIPEGKLITLLGASGCGKTTVLRCIAGLEHPNTGKIKIDGETVFSAANDYLQSPEYRPVGMVFQSYAIWPHMTVFQNVAYPLQGRKIDKIDRLAVRKRVEQVLTQVGLAELADRPAPHLSGGQQQRVALARALVANPKVLLLDEPLSNLDAKLRCQMRSEIRHLQKERGVTTIYVTHDQEEAMAISDEIIFMSQGHVVEKGFPEDIYSRPKTKLSAEFLGDANFLQGTVIGQEGGLVVVETVGGRIAGQGREHCSVGQQAIVFFRPEDLAIERQPFASEGALSGQIQEVVFLGRVFECTIDLGRGIVMKAYVGRKFQPRIGEIIHLAVDEKTSCVFSESHLRA